MSRTTHYIGAARLAPSVSSARKPDSFAVLKTKGTPLGRLCLVAKFQLRQAPTPLHRLSQAPLHLPVVPVRFYHSVSGKRPTEPDLQKIRALENRQAQEHRQARALHLMPSRLPGV